MIKQLIARQLKRFNRQIVHDPTIKNAQLSVIVPTESWKSGPNKRLLEISLKAAALAENISHADIAAKMIEFPHWPEMWPGEHYKLLSALVQAMEPMIVVEIGTVDIWNNLEKPKLDLTAFGHWSGTVLVDWIGTK